MVTGLVLLILFTALVALAGGFFATIMLELFGEDLTSTYSDREIDKELLVTWHYWLALELVPLVDPVGTLNWDEPVRYDGSWPGALVLIYKAAVLTPIVLLVSYLLRRRSLVLSARAASSASDDADGAER